MGDSKNILEQLPFFVKIYHMFHVGCDTCGRRTADGRRTECEDRARILATEFAIHFLMVIIIIIKSRKSQVSLTYLFNFSSDFSAIKSLSRAGRCQDHMCGASTVSILHE